MSGPAEWRPSVLQTEREKTQKEIFKSASER